MDDEQHKNLINLAKEKFLQYSKNNPEQMTLNEFNNFLQDFFKDDKKVLEKINPQEIFKEFSKDDPKLLSEREFREAYKELEISKAKTNDFIDDVFV
jgi:elongation factor P--beta-lysine ligase